MPKKQTHMDLANNIAKELFGEFGLSTCSEEEIAKILNDYFIPRIDYNQDLNGIVTLVSDKVAQLKMKTN